jgi:hypothetical protein
LRVNELDNLAFFLNSVTPDMTAAKWETFRKAAEKRGLFSTPFLSPPFTARVTLEEAQGLSAEIARDLRYRDKDPDVPMARLLGTLNGLELKTKYECHPVRLYGKPRPGEVILKAGKNSFVPKIYPEAKTVKELLYVTLGAALVDRTLDRLKTCLECRKWIVGKNAARKFCPDACKDNFNNRRRIKAGYFRKLRAVKRQRAARRGK